jgi:8-oxo-dGTP pyrophosphatase MutT (NUDIX family)
MKKYFWPIILLAVLLQVLPVHGQSSIDAAGVLAFTRIQGVTYVLLADHRSSDRGWGTFGGHREEGESPEEAAWREFIEETRCIYRNLPQMDLTEAPRVTLGPYVSYVVEVPYVPAQVFSSLPAPPECRAGEFNERGPWAWFPLGVLERVLEEGGSESRFRLPPSHVPKGSPDKLWTASAIVILSSIRAGYLAPPDSTQEAPR